jgi:hypothetical protein
LLPSLNTATSTAVVGDLYLKKMVRQEFKC